MVSFAPVSNQASGFMPDEGKYVVECVRIEEAPDNGFGVGVRWVLALYENDQRVLQGDGGPLEFWQTTSPNMGPKARARGYVESFLGRPLEDGERINPNDLLGKRCQGMVIHQPHSTKPDQQIAKLVSTKPLADAPKAAPRREPTQVTADATSEDIDRAGLFSDLQKAVKTLTKFNATAGAEADKAVKASNPDTADVDDLRRLLADIQASISAALDS